jgi:hypothetical protein
MKKPLIPNPALYLLVSGAVLMPLAITVVLGVGGLLSAMGDTGGGGVLSRVGLALGIIWAVDLIALLVVLAVRSLDDNSRE